MNWLTVRFLSSFDQMLRPVLHFTKAAHLPLMASKIALSIRCPLVHKEIATTALQIDLRVGWERQAWQVHPSYNFSGYVYVLMPIWREFFVPQRVHTDACDTFTQFRSSASLNRLPWWPLGYQRVSWCSHLGHSCLVSSPLKSVSPKFLCESKWLIKSTMTYDNNEFLVQKRTNEPVRHVAPSWWKWSSSLYQFQSIRTLALTWGHYLRLCLRLCFNNHQKIVQLLVVSEFRMKKVCLVAEDYFLF